MVDWRGRLVWRLGALVRPPVTLGVRCLVVDAERRVLLVRHTYTAGWHFPGGGVDAGESAAEAARREVAEETGLDVAVAPRLHGLYFNRVLAGRDHVALFPAPDHPPIDPAALVPQAAEIAEVRLAPLSALPDGLTPATARRLAEVFDGEPGAVTW